MKHRIARSDLEVGLVQLVRAGEHIDTLYLDGDDWVVITEDRVETRPRVATKVEFDTSAAAAALREQRGGDAA